MAFKPASRFGHTITLPATEDRSYRIPSPPIDVGNYLIESTQVFVTQATLTAELGTLHDDLAALPGDAPENAEGEIHARIKEIEEALVAAAERLTVPDGEEVDYFRQVLGSAYDDMVENREPTEFVHLAAATVAMWVRQGRDAAEQFWNDGGRPRPQKAPRDRRKAKRGRKQGTSK